jgi:hypothetical protein
MGHGGVGFHHHACVYMGDPEWSVYHELLS